MHDDYLILGGAGLVGLQVCRSIARTLNPSRIVVASLLEDEARAAVTRLEREFGASGVRFEPAWGNLFVPTAHAHTPRRTLLEDPTLRRELLKGLYENFESAYAQNHLVQLIATHRPAVIVDCVNTATGLSYQNVFEGVNKVRNWLSDTGFDPEGTEDLEHFLLSQSTPQLIRHVRFLHRATTEHRTRIYVKCGTTGTGGMGLNIPYTHSEDKPSKVLLAKTEAAFGHTGLLFLMARTPDSPIVKEVKPAAMIGYRAVKTVHITDKHGNDTLFEPRPVDLVQSLTLVEPTESYDSCGDLVVSVVDTGENGVFTRGEFAAITALGQMEYITPEEIAHVVCLEIRGANSGQDIISALDSSVLDPSYKAGLVRSVAMRDLAEAESRTSLPSVALGRLGPPELSKLLFEAQLLKECFDTFEGVLTDPQGAPRTAQNLAEIVSAHLDQSAIRTCAPSIGIPILAADGTTLLRGPRINVPEVRGYRKAVDTDPAAVDRWARKGWIDLREQNFQVWLDRLDRMNQTRHELRDEGSAAASIGSYLPAHFEIGEVVAWIFNNEMGGHRLK